MSRYEESIWIILMWGIKVYENLRDFGGKYLREEKDALRN